MIQRILVGVDFSAASRQAFDRAVQWSQKLEVPLVAMHVLHPPTPMLPEVQIALPDEAWLRSIEDQARAELSKWVQDLPGVEARIVWGSPAEELVDEARADDLLIVSQMGHSEIKHLIFGSIAAKVVRHAPCDVLVVRYDSQTSGA